MLRLIILLTLSLSVSGCDKMFKKTIRSICLEHPEMCNDLNKDAHCRREKAHIIQHRYDDFIQPSEMGKYKLLLDFEEYKPCVWKASNIVYKKERDKAKTRTRIRGYMTALKEIKRLEKETINSNNPYLLYYHWSRNSNEAAGDKFLAMKDSPQLSDPELQMALASYFIKFNLEEAIASLYRAISYSKDGIETINPEIYQTLTGIFLEEQELDKAYIWAYISAETMEYSKGKRIPGIDLNQLTQMTEAKGINIEKLTETAEGYLDLIDDGEFTPPDY